MKFLKDAAKICNIALDENQLKKFETYENFLLEFNSHTNLTRIIDRQEIAVKHFLDSILISKYIDLNSNIKLVDIGTGAGFPGIPLKILNEKIELTLIESKEKKVKFLKELIKKLEIEANIFHARAEEVNKNSKFFQKFDAATARAVSNMNNLTKFCLPFLDKNGIFAAMKGPEIEEGLNFLKEKKHKFEIFNYSLPFNYGERNLIIVK